CRKRDKEWPVYSVGGTPAQSVLYAILEIMPRRPDLVVSGINYGENVGSGVTISGTVGAALEGASLGVPALAISLEVDLGRQLTYSPQVDFSTARYFTTFFSRILLEEKLPEDVAVLKVDVPADATPETPWAITRQAMHRYYLPTAPERESWQEPGKMGFRLDETVRQAPPGTDVHALTVQRVVSVTPLSLDLTARVDLADLEKQLLSHRSAQMKK
ncbi:MAG: hypothetical protein M1281_01410, partial [Chloroflexi bacterium]|nr:hypothetical protein [Chloroflexota bacterium]